MMGFVINVALALIWLFLGEAPTPDRFVIGFALGFLIVALFEGVLAEQGYIRRAKAGVRFLAIFLRLLLAANLSMARAIVAPRARACPALIDYSVGHLTRAEILLLSHCITLTPGTTALEVSPDFRTLTFHAYDGADPESVVRGIRESLEAPIVAFLR